MESVNYQYHKVAGYLLYPVRVLLLLIVNIGVVITNVTLDKLHLNSKELVKKINLSYAQISTRIVGTRIYIDGGEHITDKPCINIANHINLQDHYVLANVQKKSPSFVANKMYNVFPFSSLFKYTYSIICDKTHRGGTVRKMKDYVNQGNQITIYPDGCNLIPEGQLIAPFRSGAFVPKLPIQPIVLRYVSSSNPNMNWEDGKTLTSVFNSYLLDGDIRCYVKVLPLQHYQDSYKSHDDYKDALHSLMTKELKTLPEQRVSLNVGEPSSKYTMNALLVLLSVGIVSRLIGNQLMSSGYFLQFIVGYFCNFYPTQNTCDLDIVVTSVNIWKTIFLSIQGTYDFYFRCLFVIMYLGQIYNVYKKSFTEIDYIWNLWILAYIFTCYPFLLHTLELYNVI